MIQGGISTSAALELSRITSRLSKYRANNHAESLKARPTLTFFSTSCHSSRWRLERCICMARLQGLSDTARHYRIDLMDKVNNLPQASHLALDSADESIDNSSSSSQQIHDYWWDRDCPLASNYILLDLRAPENARGEALPRAISADARRSFYDVASPCNVLCRIRARTSHVVVVKVAPLQGTGLC